MLLVAFNELMLAVEIYLAHSISGTIVAKEWIPIVFGPIAAIILGISGLISLRNRPLATILAIPTLIASIVIGLLGAYFHVYRAFQPFAICRGTSYDQPDNLGPAPLIGSADFCPGRSDRAERLI